MRFPALPLIGLSPCFPQPKPLLTSLLSPARPASQGGASRGPAGPEAHYGHPTKAKAGSASRQEQHPPARGAVRGGIEQRGHRGSAESRRRAVTDHMREAGGPAQADANHPATHPPGPWQLFSEIFPFSTFPVFFTTILAALGGGIRALRRRTHTYVHVRILDDPYRSRTHARARRPCLVSAIFSGGQVASRQPAASQSRP